MFRSSELPLISDLPAFEDDPALFDPAPEWFVPGLRPSLREGVDEDVVDGPGFRALVERPEALSKAWRTTGGTRTSRRRRRTRQP